MKETKETIERINDKIRRQELYEKDIISSVVKSEKTKIEIRVTEEEKELIKSMARLNHMNVSEFIRYIALNKYLSEIMK